MANLEKLEIHSRSYLVRWINVKENWTISWSIHPHKKSIDFGLFRHPGHVANGGPFSNQPGNTSSMYLPTAASAEATLRNGAASVPEKLKSIGLQEVAWVGRCERDKVTPGKYDVPSGEGGMYALVFDNTFSKQTSKTVTFVWMTYVTNAPPRTAHAEQHQNIGTVSSASSLNLNGDAHTTRLSKAKSTESFKQILNNNASQSASTQALDQLGTQGDATSGTDSTCITGVLQKRRRKRHQGYARRFFSLDYNIGTLSYYQNRDSSALRGSIPLSLAAIGANENTREISIDSGAEIWHLKAVNRKDFDTWREALEKATNVTPDVLSPTVPAHEDQYRDFKPSTRDPREDKDWEKVEALVSRIAGTRDAVRRLAVDTDPKYLPLPSRSFTMRPASRDSATADNRRDESPSEERRPSFWKRKSSYPNLNTGNGRRSISAQHSMSSTPLRASDPDAVSIASSKTKPISYHHHEHSMHDHCIELLRDLDDALSDFAALIAENKQRRSQQKPIEASRRSIDSEVSEEFFDADGGVEEPPAPNSQLLKIHRDSDAGKTDEGRSQYGADSVSTSGSDEDLSEDFDRSVITGDLATQIFPSKPRTLLPLPLNPAQRRVMVPPPAGMPPSLIGFFRKNVGKDLSSIAMPVSANEPTSMLQRTAEGFEYSELLDQAAIEDNQSIRLLKVAAFAVSGLSIVRVKERAIRKPFNPMLGETFELVREDKGFRFIAEKVSHHPVQLAYQAESKEWSLTQSPSPNQKFWGKSAEVFTEGPVRLVFHSTGERYSWTFATQFLRNVIAGEKYLEPVGTQTITNETTGDKAIITFKSKGMFGGRSEEVVVSTVSADGEQLPYGLNGKWTESLYLTTDHDPNSKTDMIWSVGSLVDKAQIHYGFTTFSASLNQITSVEKDRLPLTDSRLRPDQCVHEDGDLDQAEELKHQLEERQRARRRAMEEAGEEWKPRWFSKIDAGEETVWKLKTGKDGYWEERAKGEWTGITPVFRLD